MLSCWLFILAGEIVGVTKYIIYCHVWIIKNVSGHFTFGAWGPQVGGHSTWEWRLPEGIEHG